MSTTPTATIALLGGGPVGLATAMLLARAGFAATVFDARPVAAASGDRRLLALSRGTLQVLRPLLAAQMPRMASIVDVHVSSAGEFGATRIGARDFDANAPTAPTAPHAPEPLGATVYYGDLVAALSAAAEATPGVVVRRPLLVAQVAERADGVVLHLRADDGAESTAEVALAIHAEGSPGGDAAAAAAAWALTGDLRLHGPAPGDAFERFTRDGPLALLPAPAAPAAPAPRWSMVWCMGAAEAQRRAALDEAAFLAELQAAIGPRIARVTAVGPRRAVPLPQQSRAQIAARRLAWIGNAAQTLHPVAGQGLNLGMRDAVTLVDALAAARDDLPAALVAYTARRRLDRALLSRLTRWMPPLFGTRVLPVALARSAGLTALDLVPGLRREWARLLMFGVRH